MRKRLVFSAALLASALAMQAEVLFSEDWSAYITTPEELDASRWRADDGCFGSGIYSDCYGTFSFAAYGDGTLYMQGENNGQGDEKGYWPGYSLVTVPTFTASKDDLLVVETTRISHSHQIQSNSGTRTGLWLIAPDKSKWLLLADNWGESGWGFNPYSGTGADFPVNNPSIAGYQLDAFNALSSAHEGPIDLKIVADGERAWMYARESGVDAEWVLGNSVELNFSEDIAVGVGVYARAPGGETGSPLGDFVEGIWGPVTVSSCKGIFLDHEEMTLGAGSTSSEITVSVSEGAAPLSVTINSSNPEVCVPVGGNGGSLTLDFAAGETSKTFQVEAVGEGEKVNFTLTSSSADVLALDNMYVTVPCTAGVKLDEQFDSLDETIWEIDTRGYEYRSYPDADVSYDYFGVRDGQLVMENMVSLGNYWGGRSLSSKNTYLGSTQTPLSVKARLTQMDKTAGEAVCANLVLRNADSSSFFALRYNNGEGGWMYNTAIGAAGTTITSMTSVTPADGPEMEILYDGAAIQVYIAGTQAATVNWICNDPMYVQVGFYARETGASGSGAFDYLKIENIEAAEESGTVTPNPVLLVNENPGKVTITVPETSFMSEDLELSLVSQDSGVAYPEVSTIVFEQGGEASQTINVVPVKAGTTTIKVEPVNPDIALNIPSIVVNVGANELLLEEDFQTLDSTKWKQVARNAGTGTNSIVNFAVENNTLTGYFKCGKDTDAVDTMQLQEVFYPTAENPVVIEYMSGPIGGRGAVIGALGILINANNNAACAVSYLRGDSMGWNINPNYTFGTSGVIKPEVWNQTEYLDNGWHKVSIIHDGSIARFYLDGIYGGSANWATDCISFALGGLVSRYNNEVDVAFKDVKVYGGSEIQVNTGNIVMNEDTATFDIIVPSVVREAGTTIRLEVMDGSVVGFDSGAVKEITLNANSDQVQTVTLNRVGVGATQVVLSNDKGYGMSVELFDVITSEGGSLLFEDNFNESSINTNNWVLDMTPFESTNPDGAGDFYFYSGGALYIDLTLTNNYWGGGSFYTAEGYKASLMSPVIFEVTRNSMYYGNSTGARSAITIRSEDGSRWITFAELRDDTGYIGWSYNDSIAKPTGAGIAISSLSDKNDIGSHEVKLLATGSTVTLYIDGVEGITLDFPVSEGIHFGLGAYARQVGDSTGCSFSNVKIYGSETPLGEPVQIVSSPVSIQVNEGGTASFSVSATGENLVYEWYKDGVAIDYISSPTYTIEEVTAADEGVYTVQVSNEINTMKSSPAYLTVLSGMRDPYYEDELTTIDSNKWNVSTRGFEYLTNPLGDCESVITESEEGITIDVTLTHNYWGGRAYYFKEGFKASVENPAIFEVVRKQMSYEGTGARTSIIISNADGTKWINMAELNDENVHYGWGYNKLTGAPDDKSDGRIVEMTNINSVAGITDMGEHTLKMVANGSTVELYVDNVLGAVLDFPESEVYFGFGVYARMVPDKASGTFAKAKLWGESTGGDEPEGPVLAWTVEGEELVFRWAVSSNAVLEVAPTADSEAWTLAGDPAEIEDGTYIYRVPLTEAAAFYRLTSE